VAARQHGTEFGDLGVDVPLLFLESKDRSGDDFVSELCRHIKAFGLPRLTHSARQRMHFRSAELSSDPRRPK